MEKAKLSNTPLCAVSAHVILYSSVLTLIYKMLNFLRSNNAKQTHTQLSY